MADRIYAPEDAVKPADPELLLDPASPGAPGIELPASDHAMLPLRQTGNPRRSRFTFYIHQMLKVNREVFRPLRDYRPRA